MVCPYAWDVPGGVQFHVRDLAEHLPRLGHDVAVLAPADEETALPPYVTAAGRAVPVPYNGSVARVAFGPVSAARVRRWLADLRPDVLHIHEPAAPSVSLLALWATSAPVVATFHSASLRSRAMTAAYPILQPALEKISARIAVSEDARRTLVEHLGGDAVLVPNGVNVDRFAAAAPREEWRGRDGTLGFIGRLNEPRKGLPVLLEAMGQVLDRRPGVRLLVGGSGDVDEALEGVPRRVREAVTYLGTVSEDDKAALLRTVDAYVAPNTGGESFGIILVEAMAGGAPVVASSLDAFRRVLDDGRAGLLFPVGDAPALAGRLLEVLADPALAARLRAEASVVVRRYDWSSVVAQLLAVYETVRAGAGAAPDVPSLPLLRPGRWGGG